MIINNNNQFNQSFKPHRLAFFADDPNKPNTPQDPEAKDHKGAVLSEEAINKACEGSTIPNNELDTGGLTFKQWMKRSAKRGGLEQRMARDFVNKTRKREGKKEDLHKQYYQEVNNLASDNKPWSNFTKKRLQKPEFGRATERVLDLQDMEGPNGKVGQHLVQALVDGHISISKFNAWADILMAGPGKKEQQKVLAEALGQFQYRGHATIEVEINKEMTLLGVVTTTEEQKADTKASGLKNVKDQVVEVLSRKHAPEKSSEALKVHAEYKEAREQIQAIGSERNQKEDHLLNYMTKEMPMIIEDKPEAIKNFFEKNSRGNPDHTSEAGRKEGFSDILMGRLLEASRKPSAPELDDLFEAQYDKFAQDTIKAGVKVEIPKASRDKVLREMREIVKIDKKAKPYLATARRLHNNEKVVAEVKRGSLIADRVDTGSFGIPMPDLMDDEGYYKARVESELKLVQTMGGRDMEVKLEVVHEPQLEHEGQKRDDIDAFEAKTARSLAYRVTGRDANGRKFDTEHMTKDAFAEYCKTVNLRQAFAPSQEQSPAEQAQEALEAQGLRINIAPYSKFVRIHGEKKGKETIQHYNTYTINQVNEDGSIVLDQDIELFPASTWKKTTRFRNVQSRPAGTRIELGEFTNWLLRKEYIYQHREETPETSTEEFSVINKGFEEIHQEQLEDSEGFIMPERAAKVGDIVQSRTDTSKIYVIRRDPENFNMVYMIPLGYEKLEDDQYTEDPAEALEQKRNRKLIVSGPAMHLDAGQAVDMYYQRSLELFDPETQARREASAFRGSEIEPEIGKPIPVEGAEAEESATANTAPRTPSRRVPVGSSQPGDAASVVTPSSTQASSSTRTPITPTQSPSSTTDNSESSLTDTLTAPFAAAGAGLAGLGKKAFDGAKEQASKFVGKGQNLADEYMQNLPRVGQMQDNMAEAALHKQYDDNVQAAPDEEAKEPELSAEEREIKKIVERAQKGESANQVRVTPGADPVLHDKDVKVRYAPDSFLRRAWRSTTMLSNNDIFEMGKAMYEYYNRRWERNVKNRYSTVGKNIPWFGTEMDRINQQAETEEVNQFKEAMSDWGVWQIEDQLYSSSNPDQVKACLQTLAEKGQIRWADTRLWETLNKLTDSKYHIHIPVNGDPQVKDPKTGKSGVELIAPAIDSLWGEGSYNEWYASNASTYDSNLKKYQEEGKQLESDPYNNGSVTGRISQLLRMHKEGHYVDPHEYEGLIHFIIDAGKSDVANKLYFIVQGLATKNARGQTLLTMDRAGSIDGLFLNRLPWLDFIVKRNVMRANGDTSGWQHSDFETWAKKFDAACPPGFENTADKNKEVWKFLWEVVLNDDKTIVRTQKGMRNAEQMDHDDAHFLIPVVNEKTVDDILKGPTGSKKYFTYEGYNNAFPGFSELLKNRAMLEPPRVGLLYDTIKSFVRYDSIMDSRLYRSEGPRFARLDKSYLRRPSVVSSIPTGIHISQVREMVRQICYAYGYNGIDTIFTKLPEKEEFKEQAQRIEEEIKGFGEKFESLIRSDGGDKMLRVMKSVVGAGGLTGLDPNITAAEKEQGMEAAKEAGAEGTGDSGLAQF